MRVPIVTISNVLDRLYRVACKDRVDEAAGTVFIRVCNIKDCFSELKELSLPNPSLFLKLYSFIGAHHRADGNSEHGTCVFHLHFENLFVLVCFLLLILLRFCRYLYA